MWRRAEATLCRKRENLTDVDQQSPRLRLDRYPLTVRDANFKTTGIVLERKCDPAKVDMRCNARTTTIDLGLRMVADELHHEVRIEPGFVSERSRLNPKSSAEFCEDLLARFDNFREIAKDPITPRWIRWPKVWTFESKKRGFVSQGRPLGTKVQLLTPITLVLHLAVTTEVL
jgi:hypothetical protein